MWMNGWMPVTEKENHFQHDNLLMDTMYLACIKIRAEYSTRMM